MITLFTELSFILILFLVPIDHSKKGRAAARGNTPVSIALNTALANHCPELELSEDGDDPIATSDDDIGFHHELMGTIESLKEVLHGRTEEDARGRSPPLFDTSMSPASDRFTLPRTLYSHTQVIKPPLLGSHHVVLSRGVTMKRILLSLCTILLHPYN